MSLFRCNLLISLAIVVMGCGQKIVSPSNDSGSAGAVTSKPGATPAGATPDDVLASAIYQLRPENFGTNSTTDKPVSLLNSWRSKQAESRGSADQPVPVTAPKNWIASEEESRLAQAKFDSVDAVHIRDALFYRAMAEYLSDRGRDELQRVGIVVDFVCRNVSLWKDDEVEIPLPPFLIMQLGRGTAEDRAWVCAEILRQLRVDAIIIRSKSDAKGTTDKWLLGVPVEHQVYLYDLRLGLQIDNGTSDKKAIAATLGEIVSHPEWLQAMAVNETYPLTVEDLRDPAVFVMSNANFWCRRMYNLEEVLPSNDQCVLYDSLADEDGRTGLLQRIAKGGGWPVDRLKLWQYPQRQLDELKHRTEERAQEWQRLTVPFSVPIPFTVDKEGKPVFGTPERKMQRFRTDQLLGKFAEATTRYLRIRHLEVEPNPPDIERLNRMASEDAFYWTCLCKFEMGEYDTAVELLSDYLKKYDRKGKWYFSARTLLAQCHAEQDRLPAAIATLERTSSDDPYRSANAVRMKRWSAMRPK